MVNKTIRQIDEEMERLQQERDTAVMEGLRQAEADRLSQKAAEEARQKAQEGAAKRRIEAAELKRKEDAIVHQTFMRVLRETCFFPAQGRLGEQDLCARFLGGGQESVSCAQCLHGRKNPSWLAGLVRDDRNVFFFTPPSERQ